MSQPRSSRRRYKAFVVEHGKTPPDLAVEPGEDPSEVEARKNRRGKRKEYLRQHGTLWPYRY